MNALFFLAGLMIAMALNSYANNEFLCSIIFK
jgi:hypothetical protein